MKIAALILLSLSLFAQDLTRQVVPALAGRRLALVIGNQAYPWKPLTNPVNDARAVSQTLQQAGFAQRDIHLVLDARQTDLRRNVREFVESVKPGDLVFVYYSGHGVEVKGANYLLPVDLPSDATEGYVEDEAVSAQRVLRDTGDRGARVRVMVLDACRDNPLRAVKSVGGGLAPMEGRGSLIVFATEAGQTAGDSGLFRRYLLEGLVQPGVSLDDAMRRVSRNVARATNEKQVPAIYGLLLEDVVLVPGSAAIVTEPPPVIRPVVPAGPRAGQVKVNEKDGQRYVWIPPGNFMMGCSPGDTECFDDEKPAHEVEITKGFWMGQTAVTAGEWKRYRTGTGKRALTTSDSDGRKNLNEASEDDTVPAVSMTWDEAKGYCEYGGGRLPTEAEWEYAARAGSTAARYGNTDSIAWYGDNSGKKIDTAELYLTDQANASKRLFDNGNSAHPVGQKESNAWNLYDMLGNVYQWTADWYDERYYGHRDGQNPLGPPGGTRRVERGGAWDSPSRDVRMSLRWGHGPGEKHSDVGVRCVGSS